MKKEKFNDTAYKVELDIKDLYAKLIITKHPERKEMITFSLDTKILRKSLGAHHL